MANGKPEQTGQKPIKVCKDCGTQLIKDVNWWKSFIGQCKYVCTTCYTEQRAERRLAAKAKALGIKVLDAYNSTKQGYVYLIRNPAWMGWHKIGMAVDAEDRLKSYQTGSPHRDYELVHKVLCKDRRKAEAFMHEKLSGFTQRNEWFEVTQAEALAVFRLLQERKFCL